MHFLSTPNFWAISRFVLPSRFNSKISFPYTSIFTYFLDIAKAKAGEQISLTDLAAAVKAEEKAPKAKKSRAAKPKKPSIRAQLDAAKKEQSKQTQPREKTKELEV